MADSFGSFGGAGIGGLDGLVELRSQVGDRLGLGDGEDLRGCVFDGSLRVLQRIGICLQGVVDGLCLCFPSASGLDSACCCAANACGGYGTCRNSHHCQTSLRGLCGGDFAVASYASLSLASHELFFRPQFTIARPEQTLRFNLGGYPIVTFLLPTRCNSSVSANAEQARLRFFFWISGKSRT